MLAQNLTWWHCWALWRTGCIQQLRGCDPKSRTRPLPPSARHFLSLHQVSDSEPHKTPSYRQLDPAEPQSPEHTRELKICNWDKDAFWRTEWMFDHRVSPWGEALARHVTSDLYPASSADQTVVFRCSQQQVDSVEGRRRHRLMHRGPGLEAYSNE